jgi:anti-sigma factor (TIGR02949 family)
MSNHPRKLNCDEAISLLFEYIDNELEQHDHDAVEAHLEECRACFSRMEFDKRLQGLVKGPGTSAAPDELRKRVKSILDLF